MSSSLRKFIGSVVLLAGLACYMLVVLAISQGRILEAHAVWQFVFFLVAGLLWVPPAAMLIKWMQTGGMQN